MGPLAGIGDSLLFSVVRADRGRYRHQLCTAGLCCLGPTLFFLIYNGCTMVTALLALGYVGFISGSNFITTMYKNGTLKILTKCAGILGLIMVGAMTASTVKFYYDDHHSVSRAAIRSLLQDSLDTLVFGSRTAADHVSAARSCWTRTSISTG